MQGAVAALLARIVTAVAWRRARVAFSAAALRTERGVVQRRQAGAPAGGAQLSKELKGEPLKFARAFQSPSDCSSLAASFFTAASVVLRARTNTDRVTQISLEMVLRCRRTAAAAILPHSRLAKRRAPPPLLLPPRFSCCYCQICQ